MFKPREILKLIKGASFRGRVPRTIKGVSIDTRTIKAGELFIPLKGERHDGQQFITVAVKKGAVALLVDDGLSALQSLAAYHRNKFKIPVIGVTGSVGKTTTKDMLASILAQKMPTLKNEENFNNEIGVPLTLLKLTKNHRAAVIEMGMQGLGEIELLSGIVRPNIAVITNIGEAHLAFLKTKKNIAQAKSEIFKYLTPKDCAIINQDDEFFEHLRAKAQKRKAKVLTFGIIEKADVTPKALEGIALPLPGEHNIYNALAAIAVAQRLNFKKALIKKGLENFRPSSKRMEIINRPDGVKIINDTYNASPTSMAAALKVLAGIEGRKIALLGDMLELGRSAETSHKKMGVLARKLGIDLLICVGKLSKAMPADYHCARNSSAIKMVKKMLRPGDVLLVKASRGMRLEEVVEAIRNI